MGADIHIYAERKLKDGTWSLLKTLGFETKTAFRNEGDYIEGKGTPWLSYRVRCRHYSFFAALANVRGYGPDPKGLPEDVSPYVKEEAERWDGDGHSHSWYSAEEFVPIFMEHHMSPEEIAKVTATKLENKYPMDITQHICESFIGVECADADDVSRTRFVFWFDN